MRDAGDAQVGESGASSSPPALVGASCPGGGVAGVVVVVIEGPWRKSGMAVHRESGWFCTENLVGFALKIWLVLH